MLVPSKPYHPNQADHLALGGVDKNLLRGYRVRGKDGGCIMRFLRTLFAGLLSILRDDLLSSAPDLDAIGQIRRSAFRQSSHHANVTTPPTTRQATRLTGGAGSVKRTETSGITSILASIVVRLRLNLVEPG
jgi:hypothetical protein